MIPTQETADMSNPEEHFLWALRNLPAFAGTGMVTHSGFLREWSKHLVAAGFAHTDWIARLADEDGNIHVSKLPKQAIRFQPPFRGPTHTYNPAARWVPVNAPVADPVVLPDIKQMTIQENDYMIKQYKDAGLIPDTTPQRDEARVIND